MTYGVYRRLEISINMVYSKTAGKEIPMLSVIDDGHGMSHADIQRMISFGHGQAQVDDPNHIGRYGIGFKVLLRNLPCFYIVINICNYFLQNADNLMFVLPEDS